MEDTLLFFGMILVGFLIAFVVAYNKERKKTARMKSLLYKLLMSGRIDRQEYFDATSESPIGVPLQNIRNVQNVQSTQNVPPMPNVPPNVQPQNLYAQPQQNVFSAQQMPNIPQQTFSVPFTTPQPQPMPQPNAQWQFPNQPAPSPLQKPVKSKKAFSDNSAAVMLFVGAALVILAGVIFSSAAWHMMSDLQRVGIIALAAVFFFAVSFIFHRKLKLENTGLAFYMLGGVFTSISFLTLGIFGLLGEWLSPNGGGSAMLFALFTLVIAAFAAGGALIYKKVPFVYSALYGAAIAVTLAAIEITDDPSWWAFVLNCISAITLAASLHGVKIPGERNKNVFRSFSACLTVIYALTVLPGIFGELLYGWKLPILLTVILWTAQLIYYSLKFDSKQLRRVFPFFAAISVAEFSIMPDIGLFADNPEIGVCIAAAGFLVCFAVCGLVGKLSSAAANAVFMLSLYFCAFAAASHGRLFALVIALCSFAAAVVAAHGFGSSDGAHNKDFAILSLLPLSSVIGFSGSLIRGRLIKILPAGFLETAEKDALTVLCVSSLTLAAAMLYRFSGKIKLDLRTDVSDVVFLLASPGLSLFLWCSYAVERSSAAFLPTALAEFVLLTAVYVFERKPKFRNVTYLVRRVFPIGIIWFAGSLCTLAGDMIKAKDVSQIVSMLMFAVLSAAVILCFVLIPKIRTVFSDVALPIAAFFGTSEFADLYNVHNYIGAAMLASWLILALVLTYSGMKIRESGGKGESYLSLVRAGAVLVTFIGGIASFNVIMESSRFGRYSMTAVAVLMTFVFAAVFAVMKLGKISDGETKRRLTQFCSFWAVGSGLSLMSASVDIPLKEPALAAVCITLILLAITLCSCLPNDIPAALPTAALLISIGGLADYLSFPDSWLEKYEYPQLRGSVQFVGGLAVFLILFAFSRIFHREKFCEKPGKRFKFDIPAIGMAIALMMTLCSSDSTFVSRRAMVFTALVELTVFILNLMRRRTSEKFDRITVTAAVAALCSLIWAQPFADITNSLLLWKINLLPLLLFGIFVRLIWKDPVEGADDLYVNKVREQLSFASFLAAFAVLLLDALCNQTLANTMIVLVITLTIMLTSFALRSGKWFVISTASFLGLTLYITRDFFSSVQWWVYLLAAGILLISISAANEYLKTRGDSLKNRLAKMRERWK